MVLTMVGAPTGVQLVPLLDVNPLYEFPERTSFTQYGAATAWPPMVVRNAGMGVVPPAVGLSWNVAPCADVIAINVLGAPPVAESRNMTPALAYVLTVVAGRTGVMLFTFAMIVALPA